MNHTPDNLADLARTTRHRMEIERLALAGELERQRRRTILFAGLMVVGLATTFILTWLIRISSNTDATYDSEYLLPTFSAMLAVSITMLTTYMLVRQRPRLRSMELSVPSTSDHSADDVVTHDEKDHQTPGLIQGIDPLSVSESLIRNEMSLLRDSYEDVVGHARQSFVIATATSTVGLLLVIGSIGLAVYNDEFASQSIAQLAVGLVAGSAGGAQFFFYGRNADRADRQLGRLDIGRRALIAVSLCRSLEINRRDDTIAEIAKRLISNDLDR